LRISTLFVSAILAACPSIGRSHDNTRPVVDAVIRPLMAKDGIPGMAVGVVVDGHSQVFDYGVASLRTHVPVTPDTLFEIGSASKTLTATLASYAVLTGHMALSDKVAKYFPSLRGTRFGEKVTLLNLATHTPGGIPCRTMSTRAPN
jgi:beta-lactamase class C